jgi:hypothetical protein
VADNDYALGLLVEAISTAFGLPWQFSCLRMTRKMAPIVDSPLAGLRVRHM